jgi:hypothetical protein
MQLGNRELHFSRPIRNIFQTGCVIVCLAFLAAVLFPVFAQSRGGSRYSCMGNMKQLGLALSMYTQDYDDHLPRAAEWMDATALYLNSLRPYRCPQLHSSKPEDFGYAFNSLFTGKATGGIKDKANALLLSDSSDLWWNANSPGRTRVANPPRDNGSDIFAFADGHVKAFRMPFSRE